MPHLRDFPRGAQMSMILIRTGLMLSFAECMSCDTTLFMVLPGVARLLGCVFNDPMLYLESCHCRIRRGEVTRYLPLLLQYSK